MIGERLGELRKDAGLNQEQLAKELCISVETVGSYERNKTTPDDEMKLRIAKMFDVSLDYLIGAIDEQIPLVRLDRVDLPKGFPIDAIPKVNYFINLLMIEEKYKKSIKEK